MADDDRNDGPWAVRNMTCDICRAKCVSVAPLAAAEEGFGFECHECGNMGMWEDEGREDAQEERS